MATILMVPAYLFSWAVRRQPGVEKEFRSPTLVDGTDDAALEAFAAWPERMFVADATGTITYSGEPGSFGFNPKDAKDALLRLL